MAFVTRNHNEESSINGARTRHLRIDMMERKGDVWVPSEDTLAINDPSFSTCHGALDTLGNLVFSSNRPGGHGGMDLWRCQRGEDGTFGPPENLGPRSIRLATKWPFGWVNRLISSNGGLLIRRIGRLQLRGSRSLCCSANQSIFANNSSMWTRWCRLLVLKSWRTRPHHNLHREVFADFEIKSWLDENGFGFQIKAFNTTKELHLPQTSTARFRFKPSLVK